MAYSSMEAHRTLAEYVNLVIDAVAAQNGAALKALLTVCASSSYRESIALALDVVRDASRITKQVEKHSQLSDMLNQHMRCMQSCYYKHFVDSYNALERSAKYPSELS